MTLGSLFDGSGGFCLGAKLTGITPVWASEIEPFPIRVTQKRLPEVRHLGDITKLNGGEIPPVDIITFGSPCQNLSIAGKREGLDGERSGLFFEALRVIKEMREKTNGEYPKYAVWENVCGAFSSNKGEDFRTVLEKLCRLKEHDVHIPKPDKWKSAGFIVGDGYSIAWRVLDAQYWGVPQRRKRIYLVADFTGQGAGKILFESESLSGYSSQGFSAWQKTARGAGEGFKATGGVKVYENHSQDARYTESGEVSQTLTSSLGKGGNNQPLVVKNYDIRLTSENTQNVRANIYETNISRCLDTGGNEPDSNQGGVAVVQKSYGIDRAAFNQGVNALYNFSVAEEKEPTLLAKGPGAVFDNYIVRRITPLECARLQGFPDWWCDDLESENPTDDEIDFFTKVFEDYGKPKTKRRIIRWLKNPRSDSAEYKMWGNGVALPNVVFVLAGIVWAFNAPCER